MVMIMRNLFSATIVTIIFAQLASSASSSEPESCASYHHRALPSSYAGNLQEFSVVYTDRALNHMSKPFQKVMNDLNDILKRAYKAEKAVIMPGSGTFAMEAVARQFASERNVVVVRNGYFSFRWTDIFEQGSIPEDAHVVKASITKNNKNQQSFAAPPIKDVAAAIAAQKPEVVFAPQVETSAGIMLSEDYIKQLAKLAHDADALFVLDAIAAGTIWIDMKALGVDVLITAPQKGWSGHACAGIAMLGERALAALERTTSTSMVLNLKKWNGIMDAYLGGGHAYYATMPTDCLRLFRDMAIATEKMGWDTTKQRQLELGKKVREMLAKHGFPTVASPGHEAPGVVVVHAPSADMPAKLAAAGLQVAGGVPLMLGEEPLTTFRVGLFGLDKLQDVDGTVARLEKGLLAALKGGKSEL